MLPRDTNSQGNNFWRRHSQYIDMAGAIEAHRKPAWSGSSRWHARSDLSSTGFRRRSGEFLFRAVKIGTTSIPRA